MPSLARREREKKATTAPQLVIVPQPVATKEITPAVLEVPARPRIVFMEVVRDQFDEIVGLRPIYEGE